MKVLHDLIRSPIIQAGAIFASLFGIAFAIFPAALVNEVLDAFAIAVAALTVYRFARDAFRGMRERNPDGASILIVALFLIVLSAGGLRMLREIGLDLGLISSPVVGVVFGIITAVMVFGIFLLVTAPALRFHSIRLSAYWALVLALASGILLTALIFGARFYWRG